MSKLIQSLDDKSDAYNFASIINDINQIMKNSKSDSIYTINNGICYSYKKSYDDLIHQTLQYDTTSNRNKKVYNYFIKDINGLVNGKEFFAWFSESKKFINKLELYNDKFIIYTENDSIWFESGVLDEKNLNIDFKPLANYINRIKIDNKLAVIYEDDNFENFLESINIGNSILPYECKFEIKMKNGKKKIIKFRITKKMFMTYKKESNINFKIAKIDVKNKVYEVIFEINNKCSKLKNYATIINY